MRNLRVMAGRLRHKAVGRPGKYVNEQSIDQMIDGYERQYEKGLCLDVGAGNVNNGKYQRLDVSPDHDPDILVDVKDLFDFDPSNSDINAIRPKEVSYMLVRLHHVAEHIEWIHQKRLFYWACELLMPGGMVAIATPNLEYVMGVYQINLKNREWAKPMKYPVEEHPYLNVDVHSDMQWWTNFKLFSGGSPGDHHFAAYDRWSLCDMLAYSKFTDIKVHDGATLRAVAYKQGGVRTGATGDTIARATQ